MDFKENKIINENSKFSIFSEVNEAFPFGSVIASINDDFKMLKNNQSLLKILGYKDQETFDAFYGGSLLNLPIEEDREEVAAYLKKYLNGELAPEEEVRFQVHMPDSEPKYLKMKASSFEVPESGKFLVCYVGDVTSEYLVKEADEENKNLLKIAEAASKEYEIIFLKNLKTSKIYSLKAKNIDEHSSNIDVALNRKKIFPDDRDNFVESISNTSVAEQIAKHGIFRIRYRIIEDDQVHWHELKGVPTSDYAKSKNVVFSISNIDSQIQMELEKINEKNSEELETIASGIMGEFETILIVNVKTNKTRIIKQNKNIANNYHDWIYMETFDERTNFLANKCVAPEERAYFVNSSKIENVIPHLKKNLFYSFNYKSFIEDKIENWEIRFSWANKNHNNIVVAIKNIDNELKQLDENNATIKEQKRQEIFVNLFGEQYVAAFYVNLTNGTYITYKKDDDIDAFDDGKDYNKSILYMVQKRVDPLQKNLLLKSATVEGIKDRLRHNDEYSFDLKENANGNIRYIKMRVLKGHDNEHAAVAFLDVSEEYLKRDADLANERQQIVINTLTEEYDCVFYVKCNDDETFGQTKLYKANDNFKKQYKDCSNIDDFDDFLTTYRFNSVYIDDRRMFSLHTSSMILIGSINENRHVSINYRTLSPQGRVVYYEMKIIGDFDITNKLKGFVAAIHSVDEMMKKEIKDREKVERDLKTIESQKAQLTSQHEMLEKANKAKTDFLFNMSHDIRTPMNAIMGFTSLANKYLDDPEKIKDCLGKIQISGSHLLKLINEVLDMSRIESGKLHSELKTVKILDNFTDLYMICKENANSRNIDLVYESNNIENKYVTVDELHVNQIIMNILGNAVKYTMPGGKIVYSIKEIPALRPDLLGYEIVVQDNGIGMDKEFLDHIYDPFARERNTTISGIEGTGLGMSIVKKLVDYLDGQIMIESEPHKGTKVTLRFQFLKSGEVDIEKDIIEYKEEDFKGLKVLIVEDNALNREIAKEFLEDAGFIVETANDGKDALETVITKGVHYYDFVLMDIQMPIMNGYEATREIRKLENAGDLPIIALSANAFGEDKQKSLAAGMNDHVAKPIQLEELFKSVSKTVLKK